MTQHLNPTRTTRRLAAGRWRWPLHLLVCGLVFSANESRAQGQTNTVTGGETKALSAAGKSKGKNKPVISDRPQVIGSSTTTATKPSRPGTPDSGESAQLIEKFQASRITYLEAQKELKLKAATGTEEQRSLLREQSKEALTKWREEQRRYVEEQRERLKTMKQELQADLAPVLDQSGDGSGGGRGR
jgi:hypothetical protein